MEKNEDLAEIIGIMLGDGCLHKLKKNNKFQTVICFNKQEKDYLFYVQNLFENHFQYKFGITEIRCELLLRNSSVFVGKQLIESGLVSGNKVENRVIIPRWVFLDKNYLLRTVRGLFDTDGCVYKKYGTYAQIHFKFGALELTKSLHAAINGLGFNPTKIETGYNQDKDTYFWKFYLSRQTEIEKFFQDIKPRNSKHLQRYLKIKSGDAAI